MRDFHHTFNQCQCTKQSIDYNQPKNTFKVLNHVLRTEQAITVFLIPDCIIINRVRPKILYTSLYCLHQRNLHTKVRLSCREYESFVIIYCLYRQYNHLVCVQNFLMNDVTAQTGHTIILQSITSFDQSFLEQE